MGSPNQRPGCQWESPSSPHKNGEIYQSVNGKKYEAVRKIDSKGTLSAKFSEIIGADRKEIAAGERKQFGESMTQEVEKTIGLDFEKLKVASIVQQGL